MKNQTHAARFAFGLAGVIFLALALSPAGAQTIPNPSFEANSFTVFPGYVDGNGVITRWTATPADRVGLSPAGGSPFANNGATPNGANVAFVQSYLGVGASLATTLSNLTAGVTYQVTFRANCRTNTDVPAPTWSLNGGAFVAFTASPAVNALGVSTNPYYTNSGTFTATGSTAGLVISNFTAGGDSAVLVDDFRIVATPTFTNVPIFDLPQVSRGSVAWGDYDNDGRLDFLLTGSTSISLSGVS